MLGVFARKKLHQDISTAMEIRLYLRFFFVPGQFWRFFITFYHNQSTVGPLGFLEGKKVIQSQKLPLNKNSVPPLWMHSLTAVGVTVGHVLAGLRTKFWFSGPRTQHSFIPRFFLRDIPPPPAPFAHPPFKALTSRHLA